ncbi:hypothetical protein THII_2130 [Thioploca ingrica]|uniref:PIN domain-containing protein n=1 Tax=Thioploca ingrica TaxID=40754 RepID=A0A090AL24_9GAMM|nr:hypothetical protein THII_2130 [Thioploca ingrica]
MFLLIPIFGFMHLSPLIIKLNEIRVAAALENNCSILYTEDLQHNQLIENHIKIINPFKIARSA